MPEFQARGEGERNRIPEVLSGPPEGSTRSQQSHLGKVGRAHLYGMDKDSGGQTAQVYRSQGPRLEGRKERRVFPLRSHMPLDTKSLVGFMKYSEIFMKYSTQSMEQIL